MKGLSMFVPRFLAAVLAVTFTAATVHASCTPPPSGIVAWWPGEGNTTDIIGGDNGTLSSSGTGYALAEVGQGFRFDGTNGYLAIPDSAALKPTNFTLEAWVRLDPSVPTNRGTEVIIFKQNSQSYDFEGYSLLKATIANGNGTSSDRFQLMISRNTTQVGILSQTIVQRGVWYHVAATYDGTTLTLYVNGLAEATAVPGFPPDYGTLPVYIGGLPPYAAYLAGIIDEASIYNRALGSNEIAAIYLAGSAGKCTSVATAPVITSQPTNMTVVAGSTATFNVTATGTVPLSYQWSRNSTNLPGATNATLSLSNVQSAQNGTYYSVLVSNLVSSVISSNAVLTVSSSPPPPPSCTPPASGIVGWWQAENNAVDIIGGDNGILSGSGVTFAAGKVGLGFRLDGTNGYVQIPDSAALKPTTVTAEAWVWLDPNVMPSGGEAIIFKRNSQSFLFEGYSLAQYAGHFQFVATHGGNQVITTSTTLVQRGVWYHVAGTYDGNQLTLYINGLAEASAVAGFALDYGTLPVYFGATGQPAPYQAMLGGIIDEPSIYNRALASNEIAAIYNAGSAGKCTSVAAAPIITSQPTNITVVAGSTATFNVTATGTAPLSYQWSRNNANLPGATNATLTLPNVQLAQNGTYYSVLVSNLVSSVISSNAILTVSSSPPPPSCTPPPSGIIAWWPGESNGVDIIGGNNATVPDAITFNNAEVGLGFNCDGTANLNVANAPALNPTNQLTIECWVYPRPSPNNLNRTQHLITKDGECANRQYLLQIADVAGVPGAGDFGAAVWLPGAAPVVNGVTVVQTNTWYHLAMTYDGAMLKLYVNGALDGQLAATGPIVTGPEPVRLGGSAPSGCSAYLFNGILDEPTIYNRALSSNEIAAIFLAGSAGKCTPALVGPVITTQPTNITVVAGNTATFNVTATGSAPLFYQWSRNSINIPGATNATLTLPNVQLAQNGTFYSVLVSNLVSSVISSNAILTVSSPAPPPPSCTPPSTGIVAWWPAENNANDVLGADNGILQGGLGFASGETGQAFNFIHTNQSVRVPASTSLDVGAGTGFTLETWINPTDVTLDHPIFEWNDLTYWGVHFHIQPGQPFNSNPGPGELYANIPDSSGNWHQMSSTGGVVVTNVFQHVALTYDKASGWATIYCNGQIVSLQNFGSFTPRTAARDLYLGQRPAPSGETAAFAGLIDEPAIYNRALSSNEIAAIYLSGSAGKCTPAPVASGVPAIYSFTPALGTAGSVVTIFGTNFSPAASSNIVYFGAVRAFVSSASTTSLIVTVPTGATYAPVTVTLGRLVAYSSSAFEPTFSGNGAAVSASTFAPDQNIGTASPIATVIADLDGDGKPDLTVANVYAHQISVFQNIGSNGVLSASSFAPPVSFSAGSGTDDPLGVTVADVDGDGRLDLLVPDRNNNQIIVFQNLSTGGPLTSNSFAPPVFLPVAADPRRVAVRDLDGDGRPDIITVNGSGSVSILRSLGTAGLINTNSFAPRVDLALAGTGENLAVGDLDGDGKPDLAVADTSGFISLFRNNCTPGNISVSTFDARVDLPAQSGSEDVVIGDLDGDGRPELTATAYLPKTMSVYRNLSTPGSLTTNSFAAPVDYTLAGRGHTIALGDINGDGKPDIAEVTELSDALSLFQNIGPGAFTNTSLAARVDFATGYNAWGVSVGDLDGDGRPDAVLGNVYDNTLTLYKNVSPFGTPPATCTPPAAGIVAWWAAENNGLDNIGGHAGSLLNGAGFDVGEVGAAFSFTTTNAGFKVPASPNLDVGTGNGMTVEGWIKPADLSRRGEIVEWNNGDTNVTVAWGVHMQILSPGELGLGAGNLFSDVHGADGTVHWIMAPGGTITANVYQHVALTYDKTSGVATLYCNGAIVAQQNLGQFTPLTSYDFYIGRRPAGDSVHSFEGDIDEISLYNRALSTNEIAAIYLAGSAGKCSSLVAPLIVTQPTNLTVTVNNLAVFNVTAQGTGPLFYQWNFNGTNISGATNASLNLPNVSLEQAGNYSVLVSNLVGVAVSSNATLTVVAPAVPPSILAQTPSQVVLLGSPATFTVTAGGSAPLSYFWKRNNAVIPGATNSSYILPSAQLGDSGAKFGCLVINAYGFAASTNATLKVIDTVSNDLCSGAVVITSYSYTNFQSTVKASSYGDPLPDCIDGFGNGVWYQFTSPVNGLLLVDTLGSDFDTGLAIYTGGCGAFTEVACNDDYNGVTSALSIPTVAGTTYYFLIGGYDGHVGNLVFHLNYLTPPAFDVPPTNISVVVSSNATFATTISGTQPISVQWYFNNTPLIDGGRISGSTNPVLNIVNVNPNDGGNYFIVASNFVGVTTSSVAVLTPVILPPVFITPPVSQLVPTGSNVTFSAVVDGTPPYSYQWSRNGSPLVDDGVTYFGSSTSSLTISNLTTVNSGTYVLTVTNVSGSVSASATLTVMVPPIITLQPIGRSVPPGLPTIFKASASGIPAPAYYWLLNGTNVPGATASNYTNPAVGLGDLGYYQVVASNAVSSVTGIVAQLTFGPVAAWGNTDAREGLPPPGLSNVVGVAGTSDASFAIHTDGSLVAWGTGPATNYPASATNVVDVATSGSAGTYALRSDGSIVGWNGISAPALSNIVALAAGRGPATGAGYGYALRAEGTLTNWGAIPTPGFSTSLNKIKAIACGFTNAVALRGDGTVVVSGTGVVTNVPAAVTNVIAVAAGSSYVMALRADGRVIAWGSGAGTNLPAGMTNITAISAGNNFGENFGLAIASNGSLVAWGDNLFGKTNPPAALSNLTSIACAAASTLGLALVNDGSPVIIQPPVGLTAYTGRDVTLNATAVGAAPLAYQWLLNGTNIPGATNSSLPLPNIQFANAGNYQLFVSNFINTAISVPAPVNVLNNSTLVFLSQTTVSATNVYQAGKVTFNSGTVLGSGPLRYQWFSSPTNRNYLPVLNATNDTLTFDPALAVQSGSYYIAVSNLVGGVTSAPVSVRVLFATAWGYQSVSNPPVNVTNAIALATGGGSPAYSSGHYLALGSDGKVTAWISGLALYGETNVAALSNSIVTAIAAGNQTSLALKSDGTVYAWGYGAYGQTNPPTGLSGVTAIAIGGYHDLALKADGTVVGWGASGVQTLQFNYGQATNNSAATNVVAIAAGNLHSLALRADGSVVAWGYAYDGSTTIPFGVTNIVAITAGNGFSAALRANGTVVQWGNAIIYNPVPLNLSNVVAISASGAHCTALKNDGTVVAWGQVTSTRITINSNNFAPADLTNVVGLASGGDHDIALFGTRAPFFTVQPWNRSVVTNTSFKITLTGKCAGVQPVSYQWLLNGTNLPGATSDSLILTNQPFFGAGPTRLIQPGAYQLVASNAYGIIVSKPAKVSATYPLGDAVDATNLVWTTTGATPWYGQTAITHDGIDAARSGGIGGSQETILQTTLATNFSGFATFWWKVSSEQFFDTLEFRVNGTVQAVISGEVDWQQASFAVPAGTNLLQWRYSKDATFDSGLDAGFVDQFAFVAGPPVITNQPNSVVANLGASVTLSVAAVGVPQLKYQWWKDGNAVGGNSPILAMSGVTRANAGNYCVTVTNIAGSTTSSTAVVRVMVPQLLGSPQLLPDGSLQLTSADVNGGQLQPSDLPNFEAQASSDLVNWTTLPAALSLTNGMLQLQDTSRTNFTTRFYRIIEHPAP